MTRKQFLQLSSLLASGTIVPQDLLATFFSEDDLKRRDFGNDFVWGTATSAYQTEGAWNEDEKGESIWDDFVHFHSGKIKNRDTGNLADDFYHRCESDIELMQQLNIPAFRFSLSWPRIFPNGTGTINQKGIDFYHRVIDKCLSENIDPWITCYHWDLPQVLEEKGGWTNRDSVHWFEDYVELCAKSYGDKVKNWIVFNEPLSFTLLGYILGWFAPGDVMKKEKFYGAVHHVMMSHGAGGRKLREFVKNGNIGSTVSCTYIQPKNNHPSNIRAAVRADALLNRLYIEPVLGMGYPVKDLPALKEIEKYIQPGDEEKLKFDFDFWGVQNYTRVVVKNLLLMPMVHAVNASAKKSGDEVTKTNFEVYPEAIYRALKKIAAYSNVKKIIITENGAAFPDEVVNGEIHDVKRVKFIQDYLKEVLRAKREGIDVGGYFIWSFMDNFEWTDGYSARFGIVWVDFKTQQRIVKDSGKWYRDFLSTD